MTVAEPIGFFLSARLWRSVKEVFQNAAKIGKMFFTAMAGGGGGMIEHLDHLVLTTCDEARCVDFYTRVLGMRLESFVGGTPPTPRQALTFGAQKINLHLRGHEFEPKAHLPVPGALDLCFIVDRPLDSVIAHLNACDWPILEGPVRRTGATGPIRSVYVRDPDLNLIELSERL